MPTLARHLEGVEIVSARDKYEELFPDDPTRWKVEAFCQVKEFPGVKGYCQNFHDLPSVVTDFHHMLHLPQFGLFL